MNLTATFRRRKVARQWDARCLRATTGGLRRLAQLVADLMPASTAVNSSDVLLLGPSIVAAADELLLTWLYGAEGLTRDRVVDVVTLSFDATAHHISST